MDFRRALEGAKIGDMMSDSPRSPKYGAVPKYHEFHWPIIRALKETGGSASVAELYERVASDMKLSEDILAIAHGDGTTSEVEYRLAWARTYLKKVGAIDNSERGVWALTAKGRNFAEKDARDVVRQVRLGMQNTLRKQGAASSVPNETDSTSADEIELSWKEQLLGVLKGIPADSFERLCQRILRESGFTKVEVTGRSGDGGIDGAGVLPNESRILSCSLSMQALEGCRLGARDPRFSRSHDRSSG